MFSKILIANRGEIALRIHRACKEMDIATVAVHSTADAEAMHVRLADESVCIGPPAAKDSYLDVAALLTAATITGADAIHPGIGFLSENARFAEMVAAHGVTFIGPSAEDMRVMGDKIEARKKAVEMGLPIIPGSKGAVENLEDALLEADKIGYPVMLKAKAGGGGKGIQIIWNAAELEASFGLIAREAQAAFGDDALYLEKYLVKPRHIEVQILADSHGQVLHFGERDCSLQRQHQKVLEESPSPALTPEMREEIGKKAADAARKIGYVGVGTFEFLLSDDVFYFLEMNTRLQVEHPVTEMVTGIDLVREQIRVAAGEKLEIKQEDIGFKGHAIECRINAEHAVTFQPSPGKIDGWHPPGGLNVRVDSAIYDGYNVPPYYDSLIAKLIVHGTSREACIKRLARALDEFVIGGIETTLDLQKRLIKDKEFLAGDYDIEWLEKWLEDAAD